MSKDIFDHLSWVGAKASGDKGEEGEGKEGLLLWTLLPDHLVWGGAGQGHDAEDGQDGQAGPTWQDHLMLLAGPLSHSQPLYREQLAGLREVKLWHLLNVAANLLNFSPSLSLLQKLTNGVKLKHAHWQFWTVIFLPVFRS